MESGKEEQCKVDVAPPLCTVPAAVTIALLDSTPQSGSEYSLSKKSPINFSTQQKNLCYYAGLILLHKILFVFGSRAW